MDISKIEPETLLSLYSIVFQDVTLFNNTIMENIRLGKKDATDEEVLLAAKLANCDEFVSKLPNGYNTDIGENGKMPKNIGSVLCFDKVEADGRIMEMSLDRDSDEEVFYSCNIMIMKKYLLETLIQTALSKLIKNKTVIVIAHRMRTVAGADKIVVLSDGVVAEEGTAESLKKLNGIFVHMMNLQSESSNWKLN